MIYSTLRLHLTNVAGLGSSQLLMSLLPALDINTLVKITDIHLPDRGDLANYQKSSDSAISIRYRRMLPNALSRVLECLVFARRFNGSTPLLVLGDLPLRCNAPQVVFVQNSHLLKGKRFRWRLDEIKFVISRLVFALNARYANAYIVQTVFMQTALADSYPEISHRIHVIAQPIPVWLESAPHRTGARMKSGEGLRLIYPAAGYMHKNHRLLAKISNKSDLSWPIDSLKLTLSIENNPAPYVSWVECVGFLSPPEMVKAYSEVDGLLFLSTDESYGFPLVEAMCLGLPIVCPDLTYARTLCGDGAIYFDPLSVKSLHKALEILCARLSNGWWPDWSLQLLTIPKNWGSVAEAMIRVACSQNKELN